MRGAALALLLAAPAAAEDYPLPEAPGPHVRYSADRAEFDAERSELHLSGNVVLKESTLTVKGQDLRVDTERRTGRSDGRLLVEDGVSAVYGESGEFDFGRHTGRLYNSSAGMGDWQVHAREARLGGGRRLTYRGADFTSCSAKPPHYHFHASRVSVVPKKRMIARNAVFYLGRVPVFYTPILYKSLDPVRGWGWKTQPGYDNRNGPYLKNTLTTEHSETVYSKLYADYYLKQGFGYGGELQRRKGEDSRGVLYAYRIRESSTGDDRWTFLGQGYQALTSSDSLQGRFQLQSDADFNNAYVRSSFFRVTPELRNDAAVTHRFRNGTARLSYSRLDAAAEDRTRYKKATEQAPRLDYQSAPLRIGRLPWINTFSGFAVNSYDASRPYLQKSVQGAWDGTRTFNLARGVSLTPRAAFSETFYDRFDEPTVRSATETFRDSFVGRWTGAGTLRWSTPLGNWDLTETYSKRLKPDGLAADRDALDKGVERNLLTLSDVFVPWRNVWARLSSGYDFRTFRDRTVGFRDRVQPMVAEGSWRATERLSFNVRQDYQLERGLRALVGDARWGDDEGATVGGSFSHNIAEPGRYYGGFDFAVAPSSPTWRLALGVRGYVDTPGGVGGLHHPRVFEKEVSWTKRWHDFYTKLGARIRPGGVGEITARVDLKFGATDPKKAPRRDWEAEWFPERAVVDEARP